MSETFTSFRKAIALTLLAAYVSFSASAQVSMGMYTTSYTQNFDGLPVKVNGTWASGAEYFAGWKLHRTKPDITAKDGTKTELNALTVNTGTSNTGGLYSYGATDAFDRALGSIGSLNYGEFAYGLLLQNNTGSTVQSLNVSYIGEQWRSANSTTDIHRITFWYAISNDKNTFNLWPSGDKGWTQVNELTFLSPVYKSAGSPLNGNLGANRRYLTHTLQVSVPPGYYIMLRWKDADEPEADHGLAIDDVSLSWRTDALAGPSPLPVELMGFKAKVVDRDVILEWKTAMEESNDHFVIERSIDTRTFEGIGIAQGNGNTKQISNYRFIDERPLLGMSYYRLKQVDEDGTYTYSSLVSVARSPGEQEVSVYPTTTSDSITIEYEAVIALNRATVIDVMGKKVLDVPLPVQNNQHVINLSRLGSSTYLLILQDVNGRSFTRRVRKI
ncbi:T9SS type A sorting domain-containing protein [Pontibacter sp. MBLB2868]|uniref:T9SS type A sorting domain-containing protein n=1 Tax=Pontibacter sp. MBLB2868 TaxID=3451555 RepID=UPI003F74F9FF